MMSVNTRSMEKIGNNKSLLQSVKRGMNFKFHDNKNSALLGSESELGGLLGHIFPSFRLAKAHPFLFEAGLVECVDKDWDDSIRDYLIMAAEAHVKGMKPTITARLNRSTIAPFPLGDEEAADTTTIETAAATGKQSSVRKRGLQSSKKKATASEMISATSTITGAGRGILGEWWLAFSLEVAALNEQYGFFAFPIALLFSELIFSSWYSALRSYKLLKVRWVSFEKVASLPAFLIMCGYLLYVFLKTI